MEPRDQQIYQEAAALWKEVYGEQPPPLVDGKTMLDMITRGLPVVDYDRLRSPHLRASIVTRPGAADSQL